MPEKPMTGDFTSTEIAAGTATPVIAFVRKAWQLGLVWFTDSSSSVDSWLTIWQDCCIALMVGQSTPQDTVSTFLP